MLLFAILSILVLITSIAPTKSLLKNKYISIGLIILFLLLYLFYIPSFNLYFSDMIRYLAAFNFMSNVSLAEAFIKYSWEPLFILLQWVMSKINSHDLFFILGIYFIYVFLLIKTISKLFFKWQYIYVFFGFLCYPFFYDYVFNGIRQGLAMMLLLLAISYWIERPNNIKYYISLIIASLVHTSSLLISISLTLILISKIKNKYLLIIWFIAAFIYIFDFNIYILNFDILSQSEYIDTYTSEVVYSIFGETNKLGFLIYTTFFLILSLVMYYNMQFEYKAKRVFKILITSYIVFSIVFFLFGFIAYFNRIAAYAWHMIPLLVLYPLLQNKRYASLLLFLGILIFLILGWTTSPFIRYGNSYFM